MWKIVHEFHYSTTYTTFYLLLTTTKRIHADKKEEFSFVIRIISS